jgi:hypothetical protein
LLRGTEKVFITKQIKTKTKKKKKKRKKKKKKRLAKTKKQIWPDVTPSVGYSQPASSVSQQGASRESKIDLIRSQQKCFIHFVAFLSFLTKDEPTEGASIPAHTTHTLEPPSPRPPPPLLAAAAAAAAAAGREGMCVSVVVVHGFSRTPPRLTLPRIQNPTPSKQKMHVASSLSTTYICRCVCVCHTL